MLSKLIKGILIGGCLLFSGLYTAYLIEDPKVEIVTKTEGPKKEENPIKLGAPIQPVIEKTKAPEAKEIKQPKKEQPKVEKVKVENNLNKSNETKETNPMQTKEDVQRCIDNINNRKDTFTPKVKKMTYEERNAVNKKFNEERGIKTLYEIDTDKNSPTYGQTVHVKGENENLDYYYDWDENGLVIIKYKEIK